MELRKMNFIYYFQGIKLIKNMVYFSRIHQDLERKCISMANRPSNSEIEKILARRRQAGKPAKKDNPSQAEIEQAVKEAVNNALGESNANLNNFLKNFKESIEKQKSQNKGAKKMSNNIKNNDLVRKNAVKKSITDMLNGNVLLPAEERLIVSQIQISPMLKAFRLTHQPGVSYHIPSIGVDGGLKYQEVEMTVERSDRHVVPVSEHDMVYYGEKAVVDTIQDVVNKTMNKKVINFLIANGDPSTSIFTALNSLGDDVGKAIIITSPLYLETILGFNNLPYQVFVDSNLGEKSAIIVDPLAVAVNFQVINVGADKQFDTGIYNVGVTLANSGVAELKAGKIFVV